jgi:hypothetical protein
MTNGPENRRTLTRSMGSNPTPSVYFKPFAASRRAAVERSDVGSFARACVSRAVPAGRVLLPSGTKVD